MPNAISLAARVYEAPSPAEARGAAKTEAPPEEAEREKLSRACKEFESVFLGHLLKSMRATTKVLGDGESAAGAGMMTEVMDEHLAMALASKGGIGLGDALERRGLVGAGEPLAGPWRPALGTERGHKGRGSAETVGRPAPPGRHAGRRARPRTSNETPLRHPPDVP